MNARSQATRAPAKRFWNAGPALAVLILTLSILIALPSAVLSQEYCAPTGAHVKHGAFGCGTCHVAGGVECFDPAGSAFSPFLPAPLFSEADKTCSNVACHSVLPGTYEYYFPGGDGEPELKTAYYGSTAANTTPSWYATAPGCATCHGNPPRYGNYNWHSGYHIGECQLCHADASGSGGVGTTITDPSLHANGAVDVFARFRSSCFGCH